MKKYKMAVVDDDQAVLSALVETVRRSGFEVQGFDEAERMLAKAFDKTFPPSEPPDVVLIDLQLKPRKMQGMALVAELASRKHMDSALMVMSGNLASADLVEAIKLGAGAGLQKPFERASLIPVAQRLAEVSRRRRMYRAQERATPLQPDSSRLRRPVFLSYSGKDEVLANGLRLNIEARGISVWYAPTTIPLGDPWKARIEAGVREARILVALLTDSYVLNSRYGMSELLQFQARVDQEEDPKPLILPVVAELSNKGRKSGLYQQIVSRYQCVDVSNKFIDGLTALLLRIEGYLDQQKATVRTSVTIKDQTISLPLHSEKGFS